MSTAMRGAWIAALALFGAATGAVVAWYAGLLWLAATIDRGAAVPPDLGDRLGGWLWPAALPAAALLGAAGGARLARRARGGWGLAGGGAGAALGAVVALAAVGAWSIAGLSLDPDAPAPSVGEQAADLAVFGLLLGVPLCLALLGGVAAARLSARLSARAS